MSRIYKTARGKSIDMDKVKLSNETATAVGNMRVNARGDLIGAGGEITQGRNELMDQVYAVPQGMYSPNNPSIRAEQQSIQETNKAKELHDLANNLSVTGNPESVMSEKPVVPPARGSLAGSVAKPVAVTQEPVSDPRKQKGPSRI